MSTHKGSRSRVQDHEAAREAWERVFGKKDRGIRLCKCGEPGPADSHPCPYKQEIHNDETHCFCCEACEHECNMDI